MLVIQSYSLIFMFEINILIKTEILVKKNIFFYDSSKQTEYAIYIPSCGDLQVVCEARLFLFRCEHLRDFIFQILTVL